MFESRRSALAIARYTTCAFALTLVGCGPDLVSPRPGVSGPTAEIQDAVHNAGVAHFFFTSPITRDPAPTGRFNGAAQPVVRVCEWTGTDCSTVVAEFAVGRGTGGSTLRVDKSAERYFVNWNTGQCNTGACVLDPAKTYRIRVLVGGLEAGHADIDVVSTQAQARNVDTNEYIALVDGKVLQIRFRIEDGLSIVNPVAHDGTRHPNSQRYRDAGAHPATGREGSAALEARALLGRDGSTVFELTTGRLDAATAAPGNLDHVQFKLLAADNTAYRTENFTGLSDGGSWTRTYAALGRHQAFQLQANVSGIDGDRTDVVTVQGAVQRRPDLTAVSIDAPAQVAPNTNVPIIATVSERNGDVGATANCVLTVDGVEADRANGIWVDAGSAVNCQFSTTFTRSGTSHATVTVESVVPGDDDLSNNSVSATITVVQPNPFSFSASFVQVDYRSSGFKAVYDVTAQSTDGSYLYSDHNEYTDQRFVQSATLYASRPGAMEFPIAHLEAAHASGGAELNRFAFDRVPGDYTYSYSYSDPVLGPVSFSYTLISRAAAGAAGQFALQVESATRTWGGTSTVPAGGDSWTYLYSWRTTGEVSYYGHDQGMQLDDRAGQNYYWSYDYGENYSAGELSSLGSDYVMTAAITNGGEGAESFTIRAPITSFSSYRVNYDGSSPYCSDASYVDWLERTVEQRFCYTYSGGYAVTSGSTSGTSDSP